MNRARDQRIPELDGWRVLLVFVVSWFHIWQQSWLTPGGGRYSLDWLVRSGYMPVDGTILLSGFLLYLPWARALLEGRALPRAGRFYQRRISRILPSYYAFLLLDLFLVVLPQQGYSSLWEAVEDMLTHMTFTHVFTQKHYLGSPLFGGTWTLAVEAQMYLLFPWIARAAAKKPGATLCGMALLSAYFRAICVWRMTDYSMVLNQLASFLDVYALGMGAALLYVRLDKMRQEKPFSWKISLAFTAAFALSVWAIVVIRKAQAASPSYPAIQSGQMMRRPYYALALCGAMLSLPFTTKPLRLLFGNRLTHALAAISMNYYLVHQVVATQLRHYNIPYSELPNPNQAGGPAWQYPFTWLCFGISVAVAAALTLLIEKPAAFGLDRLWQRVNGRRDAARAAAAPQEKQETGL